MHAFFIIVVFVFMFFECSLDWFQTLYVTETGLELLILLPQPPSPPPPLLPETGFLCVILSVLKLAL